MIRIAIAGAAGRMGRRIAALCSEYEGMEVTGAFERAGHPELGRDIGTIVGLDPFGVELTPGVESILDKADVLIDFTAPEATLNNMKSAAGTNTSIVIGTTGIDTAGQASIKEMASDVPCVYAGNMSLGINLLTSIVAQMARSLGDDYDVEIIETHHKMKKDAPSGTAFMLANAAANALGRDIETDGVFERHGIIGQRGKKEIGVQSIRGGDVVGEHTVMFLGMGECIEISHKVSNRDTFARGALKAARWLSGRPADLYDMKDVLGLK
jgi:4-hydroxy-tetrahydrodipicolinate reductase